MVYKIFSSVEDFANLFRSFHYAPDTDARSRLVKSAPFPPGTSVTFKVKKSETLDQDRIHLPLALTSRLDRVYGIIASIKPSYKSANTHYPACAQVLLRLPWWDDDSKASRSLYVRTNAHTAGFAPRIAHNASFTMRRGDVITGLIHRPSSPLTQKNPLPPPFLVFRNPTPVLGWGRFSPLLNDFFFFLTLL